MFEEKEPVKLRTSDASTIDNDFLSDGELLVENIPSLFIGSIDPTSLYLPLSNESTQMYADLTYKLNVLYSSLEEELEPICVRDIKSMKPASVSLGSVNFSRISQRRSTLPR